MDGRVRTQFLQLHNKISTNLATLKKVLTYFFHIYIYIPFFKDSCLSQFVINFYGYFSMKLTIGEET